MPRSPYGCFGQRRLWHFALGVGLVSLNVGAAAAQSQEPGTPLPESQAYSTAVVQTDRAVDAALRGAVAPQATVATSVSSPPTTVLVLPKATTTKTTKAKKATAKKATRSSRPTTTVLVNLLPTDAAAPAPPPVMNEAENGQIIGVSDASSTSTRKPSTKAAKTRTAKATKTIASLLPTSTLPTSSIASPNDDLSIALAVGSPTDTAAVAEAPTTTRRPRAKRAASTVPTTTPTVPPTGSVGSEPRTGDGDPLTAAFAALRKCESGGRYDINTGNGYYGAYQFSLPTWRSLGYPGYPHQATPAVQDEAARKLQRKAGWGQWPACSRKLGLR